MPAVYSTSLFLAELSGDHMNQIHILFILMLNEKGNVMYRLPPTAVELQKGLSLLQDIGTAKYDTLLILYNFVNVEATHVCLRHDLPLVGLKLNEDGK